VHPLPPGQNPFSHGLCERCTLDDDLAHMLQAAHDADQLTPLASALRAGRNRAGTVRWLRTRPAGQLLVRLTGTGQPPPSPRPPQPSAHIST
jgi:hypothetical protein